MLVTYPLYPDKSWHKASAHEAGFDSSKLERAKSWLDRSAKTRRLSAAEGLSQIGIMDLVLKKNIHSVF
jgi:hypothetical protein